MNDLKERKAKAEWLLSLKRADGSRESECLYTDLCSWFLEAVEENERLKLNLKLIELNVKNPKIVLSLCSDALGESK